MIAGAVTKLLRAQPPISALGSGIKPLGGPLQEGLGCDSDRRLMKFWNLAGFVKKRKNMSGVLLKKALVRQTLALRNERPFTLAKCPKDLSRLRLSLSCLRSASLETRIKTVQRARLLPLYFRSRAK